jgi:hypothetical protein
MFAIFARSAVDAVSWKACSPRRTRRRAKYFFFLAHSNVRDLRALGGDAVSWKPFHHDEHEDARSTSSFLPTSMFATFARSAVDAVSWKRLVHRRTRRRAKYGFLVYFNVRELSSFATSSSECD